VVGHHSILHFLAVSKEAVSLLVQGIHQTALGEAVTPVSTWAAVLTVVDQDGQARRKRKRRQRIDRRYVEQALALERKQDCGRVQRVHGMPHILQQDRRW
jgi:hypothetical protein